MTSSPSLFGDPTQVAYAAVKAAMIGVVRSLALEAYDHGVLVNAVAPGARTRMVAGPLPPPIDRSRPEAVAPVGAYLASRACAVTGRTWLVTATHVGSILVGATSGVHRDAADEPLTAEYVGQLVEDIEATDEVSLPTSMPDLLAAWTSSAMPTRHVPGSAGRPSS